jgi:L-iditol 2-dehydrogenase
MRTNHTIAYRNGEIHFVDYPVGDPKANEVQLRGGACGICSWDISTCQFGDQHPAPAPAGHEGVAYVAAVGAEVTKVKVGQRVVANNPPGHPPAACGFSTVRNVPAYCVYPIPESPLADEFWLAEPVSCAVTGLNCCHLRPGAKVVALGCGFMGLLMIQGLLRSFAADLIAIDTNPDRLDKARELGVSECYRLTADNDQELGESLFARQIDVVVDSTGAAPALDLASRIVRVGGLINLFGWIKSTESKVDTSRLHLKAITIINSAPPAAKEDPFPAAIRMMHKGIFDLRPLISHVVPLSGYPDLMKRILDRDPTYLKGVVRL